ncbi:hypothetical protein SAMN05444349_11667 [Bacteroides faecichinchillae]|uniref:Uncharacterized protein n=1 Tax=Bacteroides faecichinchillae TaxID=871325 RepID=A0A1M5ATI1_9BACE|nr:hypothetical protein SAMN05444349_11667 [Bacteroides faecichinchillae]
MVMKKGILVLAFILIAINQTIGQTNRFASTSNVPILLSSLLHVTSSANTFISEKLAAL